MASLSRIKRAVTEGLPPVSLPQCSNTNPDGLETYKLSLAMLNLGMLD
jgi:hypothetical protein